MAARSEEKGASIHILHPRVRRPDTRGVHFVFRIDNHPHILRAYGPDIARSAPAELNRLLTDFFGSDALVTPMPGGRLKVLLRDRALLGDLPLEHACEKWLHSFCAAIALVPIECAGERLHLSLSGAWVKVGTDEHDGSDALISGALRALERVRFSGDAPDDGDVWGARYRGDMAAAADLFAAINAEETTNVFAAIDGPDGFAPPRRGGRQVSLAWQAVRSGDNEGGVLYYECLLRLIDADGNIHPPGGLVQVLERLGLARALDRYILSEVITELENDPDVTLGANISAQSALFDGWWDDIEQRLAADRGVAERLVIEITETTAMPSIPAAAAFASRMRSLGCMIALDDFGTGFASIRQLLALSPDIAKIDRFFIERAARSERDRDAFVHLVGLARALIPTVIVEGVENEAQRRLALEAGAHWQQGYHYGRPTLTRTWQGAARNGHFVSLRAFNRSFLDFSTAGWSS